MSLTSLKTNHAGIVIGGRAHPVHINMPANSNTICQKTVQKSFGSTLFGIWQRVRTYGKHNECLEAYIQANPRLGVCWKSNFLCIVSGVKLRGKKHSSWER